VQAGTAILWDNALLLDDNLIANPTATTTATIVFHISTTSATCNGQDSMRVTVNALPIILAGPNLDYCIGDSAQLNASGGNVYVWTPTTGLSDTSIANPFASGSSSLNYIVFGTNTITNCTNSDTVLVTVNPLPIAEAGDSATICINDSTQFSASGGIGYSWSPVSTLNNSAISNPFAKPIASVYYYVTVTDVNTCSNFDSVYVTVNPLPVITITPNLSICLNDSAQLIVSGGNIYNWSPGSSLNTQTNDSVWATPILTTNYYVTVTDINGCINYDSLAVSVDPLPSISAGADVQFCIGGSVQLQATGGTTYLWSPNTNISSTTAANPIVSPPDTMEYVVEGTSGATCQSTDTVLVIVNPMPIVDAGLDTNACRGTATVIGGNPTGPALSTYLWTPASFLNNPSLANPTVTAQQTTEYIVEVTDTNGCIAFGSMKLKLWDHLIYRHEHLLQ